MSESILLVDDEELVLDSLSAVLKKEGYDVRCAKSGDEALGIIREKGGYDLVITDIKMDGMNGIEVAEKVRDITPETRVMVITGYGSLETAVKAQHRGVSDYLIKPINIQTLRNSVRRALKPLKGRNATGARLLDIKLKDVMEYFTLTSEFTSTLNNSFDATEIMEITIDRLKKIAETELTSVYVFPKVINELYYLKNIKDMPALSAGSGISSIVTDAAQWITEPLVLSSEDEQASQAQSAAYKPLYDALASKGLRLAFIMPLIVKNRVMGVVDVCSSRVEPFSEIDINLFKTLIGQTSLALAKALSYLEMEERSKEIGLLYNLSLRLNQSLKITDSIKAICEGAVDITAAEGSLLQTSLEPGSIKNFIFNKDLGFHKEMKRGTQDWLIPASARKQAFFSNDPVMDSRVNSLAMYSLGIKSLAYVPLIHEWEDLGGLTVFNKTEAKPFEERDLHLLHLYARPASEVLLNSQLFEAIKKSREKIINEKNKMDIVLGNMTDGVATIGVSGKISFINEAMLDMLGVAEEQAVGMPCNEIFKMKNCGVCPVWSTRGNREHKYFDDAVAKADGDAIPVSVSLGPTKDGEGRVNGWVEVVRNVTAVRELEDLKDSFVHALAHDIRVPLTSLIGFIELLGQRQDTTESQNAYLKTMLESALRMNSIITDLLDVYRSKKIGLAVKAEEVDVKDLVRSAIREMSGMAGSRGVSLMGVESEETLKVNADSDLIKRVLSNLLSNAIKYTPDGGTVRVDARKIGRSGENESAYEITVEDSGKGIDQNELNRIFDIFYQADFSANKGQPAGTGLGLAISREIVEAHGGRIWAESGQGAGTKFKFILPGIDS